MSQGRATYRRRKSRITVDRSWPFASALAFAAFHSSSGTRMFRSGGFTSAGHTQGDGRMSRPKLLDLFSGAGGGAVGYHRAGFDVTGVDIRPMPRYPFEHIVADALDVLADGEFLAGFDAVHASPPCRDHSPLAHVRGAAGTGHLLAETRRLLRAWDGPYVIENVADADMPGSLVLCGTEFGLKTVDQDGVERWLKRHRRFESNVPLWGAGGHYCGGRRIGGVYGNGGGAPRTQVSNGGRRRGGYQLGADQARAILGVPWMNRDEAAQCIPPVYTEHVGGILLDHIRDGVGV